MESYRFYISHPFLYSINLQYCNVLIVRYKNRRLRLKAEAVLARAMVCANNSSKLPPTCTCKQSTWRCEQSARTCKSPTTPLDTTSDDTSSVTSSVGSHDQKLVKSANQRLAISRGQERLSISRNPGRMVVPQELISSRRAALKSREGVSPGLDYESMHHITPVLAIAIRRNAQDKDPIVQFNGVLGHANRFSFNPFVKHISTQTSKSNVHVEFDISDGV